MEEHLPKIEKDYRGTEYFRKTEWKCRYSNFEGRKDILESEQTTLNCIYNRIYCRNLHYYWP